MQGCFVEFSPPDDLSLLRTIDCVNCVAALKRDGTLAEELSASERAYFWEPSSEELQEWNDFWFSTPIPLRHSPSMPTPGWSFESMVSAISEAEFDITGVATEGSKCYLTFEPESYPFGGVGCLVALLECLGNEVSAVNDGTGVLPHAQRVTWQPRRGKQG
jgi:hypothetical protein